MNGETSLNDRVQDMINGLAGHNALADRAMMLVAKDLILLAPLLLLALWLWPARSADRALNQRVALAAVFAVGLALALGTGVGRLVPEARPFVSDRSTTLLMAHAPDNGLPSDHGLAAFAVAGTVIWWRRRLGIVAIIAAAWIGVARIYAGVHWPGDILAGALIGVVVGGAAAWTTRWWRRPQHWASRFLPAVLCACP